jgi:thioredoxin-like negative regulator of GroEL
MPLVMESPLKSNNTTRAAKNHAATTSFYKVDVDANPNAKENLKLNELPAAVVFKDGKEISRVEGINKEKAAELIALISAPA